MIKKRCVCILLALRIRAGDHCQLLTHKNSRSLHVYVKLTVTATFVFVSSVSCSSHLDLGWLQTLVSWKCTWNNYFLQVSLKCVHWFVRYFDKQTDTHPNLGRNYGTWSFFDFFRLFPLQSHSKSPSFISLSLYQKCYSLLLQQ